MLNQSTHASVGNTDWYVQKSTDVARVVDHQCSDAQDVMDALWLCQPTVEQHRLSTALDWKHTSVYVLKANIFMVVAVKLTHMA